MAISASYILKHIKHLKSIEIRVKTYRLSEHLTEHLTEL